MLLALHALTLAALLSLALGAANETCPEGQHADPLVTYILTAGKATLSALNKAKNLYRLTMPLAAAVPTVPYMINSHPGGLQQGVLDTKRFVADWAALSEAADYRKGRYAMPFYAAAVQCQKENVLNAANATLSPSAANVMMLVHGSPHAIVADIYHVEVAKGVAAFSLRWIKAPKDTPDFGCHAKQDMQKAHYHHRLVAGCELEIAEDIALPGAALRDVSRGATLFIKMWVFRFLNCSKVTAAGCLIFQRDAALDGIAVHAVPPPPPLAPARRRVAGGEPAIPRAVPRAFPRRRAISHRRSRYPSSASPRPHSAPRRRR
jgi:hypothetical protein